MSYKKNDANIRCPFFESETEKSIVCEGFVKTAVLITRFPNEKKKIAYINKYCAHCTGGDCYLAKSQYERYSQQEE